MVNLGREFKVSVIGEIMMTRPISVFEEPEFLSVIKLFRNADVALTNIEGLFGGFSGYSVSTGTPMSGETWLAEEYKWAGFNLVSIANNHTMDYGVDGLLVTMEALEKVRLAYAGAGGNLWEARQPAYLETKMGRAAMVASTSAGLYLSTHSHSAATENGKGLRGRPGVNPLRYDALYKVTPSQFDEMKKIVKQWKMRPSWMLPIRPINDSDELNFLGNRIVESNEPGVQYIPLKADVEGNLKSIRNAKKNASLVVASNHSHERNPAKASE
jgi:poly-gamma-glutamate synthesis protein (capsule biosynthesis protein)